MFLANSKWIHYLFREFTIYFATQLWFHFLFHEFAIFLTKMQWIHYFRYYTMNTLSVSRIHYQYREFTFFLANSLWIYLVFYNSFWIFTNLLSIERIHFECSINSLSVSLISHEFTILFLNSLWIYYIFRELTMNSYFYSQIHHASILCLSRIGYEFIFAN